MDNLAHSLAGAALGYAGLKNKTGLGLLTLIVAANIPDVDGVAMLADKHLVWRRGWTHGPIGVLLLPPLIAAAILGFDRWQSRRGTRPADRPPVRFGPLLLLAYIGAVSHPLLDLLNTYGLRLLMPFSERWFYGDSVFIIDVWVWAGLAAGVWASHRRVRKGLPRPTLPAIASLAAVSAYIGLMVAVTTHAEWVTARAVELRGLGKAEVVVANPGPFNPLRRRMVFRIADQYGFGEVRWTPGPELRIGPALTANNMSDEAVAMAARDDTRMADFLYWSRLPLASIAQEPDALVVTVWDARYADKAEGARFRHTTRLPRTPPSPPQR
jgi:inner membrane protein